MLEAINCTYSVGGRELVSKVSLRLRPGIVTALMGPNGAGKSTLLKTMSGQLTATSGEIRIHGKPISAYTAPQLARIRAMLSQSRSLGFPFRVHEVVMLGRHPHTHVSATAVAMTEAAKDAMKRTDSDAMANQVYNTLSGGEAARVDLARVLAQETEFVLLDEPTNHLDPRHQVSVLRLCKSLAREDKAVAVCLHDLNLAANFCDEILLMKNGRAIAFGPPEETLTRDTLEEVYDVAFEILRTPEGFTCIIPACSDTAPLAVHF